jgi:hypothetical protein
MNENEDKNKKEPPPIKGINIHVLKNGVNQKRKNKIRRVPSFCQIQRQKKPPKSISLGVSFGVFKAFFVSTNKSNQKKKKEKKKMRTVCALIKMNKKRKDVKNRGSCQIREDDWSWKQISSAGFETQSNLSSKMI